MTHSFHARVHLFIQSIICLCICLFVHLVFHAVHTCLPSGLGACIDVLQASQATFSCLDAPWLVGVCIGHTVKKLQVAVHVSPDL